MNTNILKFENKIIESQNIMRLNLQRKQVK